MSTQSDSNKRSESKKRSFSPEPGSESPLSKQAKVDALEEPGPVKGHVKDDGQGQSETGDLEENPELREVTGQKEQELKSATANSAKDDKIKDAQERKRGDTEDAQTPNGKSGDADGCAKKSALSTSQEQSDSRAIAAAEVLASLTRGNEDEDNEELPCSSKQAGHEGSRGKSSRLVCTKESSKPDRGQQAEAAVADSSSSLLNRSDREGAEQMSYMNEEDDSLHGSSSTPSSSLASDNDDNEDGECAIVSVKMAPEIRQSVALLAQVQMRLDALEKKGARLHQRLELKLGRQRRPHLDQRSAITQAIPGFWVTALLNHPHLSAHIDENDEDALSYMTNLEIDTFKNNKLGYRISFHFRRNPYFQNNVIVKEIHLGTRGSPVSFSNPILWHRGQNLTGNGEPRRTARGVYQSFFNWFSDHSNPGRDDLAQILKDDLYRNPLRYYLTPLWEPRENGSAPKASDNSNGDECVVISDSDDDNQEEAGHRLRMEREEEDDDEEEDDEEEEEEEEQVADSDDSDRGAGDSSYEEKEEEEVDVEEVDESHDSGGCEVREEEQVEEDVDVDDEDEG